MDAKREADELSSRCVALVIFYQHLRKTRPDRTAIDAELRDVAAMARKAGVAPATLATQVLRELDLRYDRQTARRLHRELLAGFIEDVRVGFVTA